MRLVDAGVVISIATALPLWLTAWLLPDGNLTISGEIFLAGQVVAAALCAPRLLRVLRESGWSVLTGKRLR